MGHSVFGGMQRLNIEAARRQAGQDLLQTPNPALLPQSSGGGGTPISLSTPDILNSLIAITNPFFDSAPTSSENVHNGCSSLEVEEPQEKKVFANLETPATTAAAIIASTLSSSSSSTISHSSSTNATTHLPSLSNHNHHVGGSNIPASIQMSQPLPSMSQVVSSTACGGGLPSMSSSSSGPQSLLGVQLSQFPETSSGGAVVPSQQLALTPVTPVSSVQSMRSQLIKEGLKLTIQTKRKKSGKEELDVKSELVAKRPKREEVELTSLLDFSISNDSNESISQQQPTTTKLTPEDEERRRRRRERNKVAATKCRNKKKEKTFLLVKESEVLETENITLKSEISKLEEEYQRLSALLASHTPNCLMNLTGHQNLQNPKGSSNNTTNMSSLNGSTSSNNNNASHNNNNHSSAIGGMPYSAIATATTISSNTEMDDNDDKYGDSLFTSISSSNHQHHLHHSNHHNILQHNNNNNTTANHFVGGGSNINSSGGNSSSNIPMKFDYFQQINYNQPIQLS